MPLANRDKESLYPPGKLSLWFLATSGVLVACVFWMLADDFIRPWKGVQKDYFRRAAALLDVKREVESTKLEVFDARKHDQLRNLNRQVAAARQTVDAKAVAPLEAELAEQLKLISFDERDIKALKGSQAAVVNEFENARLRQDDAAAAKLSERQNAIASEKEKLERHLVAMKVGRDSIQAKLDALLAPVKKVEKERDDLLAEFSKASTQFTDARARTESNQWRNMPMADIIDPSIKIEKVVLDNIHDDMVFATSPKVDMCMTCHRGIEGPLVSEREDEAVPREGIGQLLKGFLRLKFGEKAWDKLKDKPEFLKAITPANVRRWLTGPNAKLSDIFAESDLRDALGEENFKKEVVGKDLLAAFHIEPVQWAHPHLDLISGPTSPHQVVKVGCTVCHGGVGRRLDFSRATHTPDSREQAKVWEEKHGWDIHGAEYVEFPMLPARYVEGQCYKCHGAVDPFLPETEPLAKWESVLVPKMAAAFDANGAIVLGKDGEPEKKPVYDENGDVVLTFALDKDKKPGFDPGKATFEDAQKRPLLDRKGRPILDSIGKPRLDQAGRPPVDENGQQILRRVRAPNAVDGTPAEIDRRWHAETYRRGVAVMQEWACTGCHSIKDFERRPGFGDHDATYADNGGDLSKPAPGSLTAAGNPKIGPDLTHLRDKTTEAWVQRWIAVPNAYRLDTRMPSFYRWRAHDDHYALVLGSDGKPQDVPLVDNPTPKDLVQNDVEVRALAAFLVSTAGSDTRASTYPEIPVGDPKQGAKTFYSIGCYACHIGPGNWDLSKGQWADGLTDDGARFKKWGDELPPGPRLTSLGSKYTAPGAAKMLAAWIAEPRHYNSVTRMPNVLQGRAEMGPDNVQVVRSEQQIRADLVAYLLAFKDAAFEAQPFVDQAKWTAEHESQLNDFWVEWYGKTDPDDPRHPSITQEAALRKAADRPIAQRLEEVGKKLVVFRGCFGCHNIKGTEAEQPIGKELTKEGSQDIHKFDFGIVPKTEIPHTRYDWIDNKLVNPRVYDKGKFKPSWNDKLRMPKFNFTSKDREAVVAVVLGLVAEPIKSGALPKTTPAIDAIARGRAVIERYRCYQCHSIEGRRGVLTAEQADRGLELWMLPPNLYGEGNRVHADWLFKFLKNPYLHQPDGVRPAVIQQMPRFQLSDEEASAMVDYFNAVAGRKDRLATDDDDEPLDATPYKEPVVIKVKEKDADGKSIDVEVTVRNLREEAKALFQRQGCIKCHLPKGAPVTANGEGASAPPYSRSAARRQRSWMYDLLHNPQNQIPGTKMPSFWPLKRVKGKLAPPPDTMDITFPQFLVGARFKDKPTNDDIADAQMAALVRYLRFHYEPPAAATVPPEPASAGK